MLKKSCVFFFSFLYSCDLFRYTFKVWITQRFVSFLIVKISSFGGALHFFQVFSNFARLNTTFSSERERERERERDMKLISKCWIFEALEVDVTANNIVSLKVRFLLGRDLLSVQLSFINSRTIWTSQVDEYAAC